MPTDHQPVREQLLARRQALVSRVARIDDDLKRKKGALAKDSEEQAIELENDEVLNALDDSSRTELKAIDLALARLDAGTYDRCGRCGHEIGEKRLKALPYTSVCIQCAD